MSDTQTYDVVIIGAGLAGLTLARHLLLYSDKRVLHIEKREALPDPRQKVGESSVQIAGFYYAKVLDLEEYFHQEQLLKYNLRFYWRTQADANQYENYSQGYIRNFSNIPSYQIDRNRFERDVMQRNLTFGNYTLSLGCKELHVELSENGGRHTLDYVHNGVRQEVDAAWVIDASGRNRVLARQMDLRRPSKVRHATSFFWLEGLINLEKLTDLPQAERIRHPMRREIGHQPVWLATNHLMDDGMWFWLIPIKYRTSFGLVYDQACVKLDEVDGKEKLLAWLFERFPLLRRALDKQDIIDFTVMRDYTHDCEQTINAGRWAMVGEAGRFSDPLYSPGSDLISIYNSLIVDAILSDEAELKEKVPLFEAMMKTIFHSFMPSYDQGYPPLGDQECFCLKYGWELSVYFGFLVFPFMNGLFTDKSFLPGFFRRFSELGDINRTVQNYIADYYQWKRKRNPPAPVSPIHFDFMTFPALQAAEKTFYKTGCNAVEAHQVLDEQSRNLREFAAWILAHIDAATSGNSELLHDAGHIETLDIRARDFAQAQIDMTQHTPDAARHAWSFDPNFMYEKFHAE